MVQRSIQAAVAHPPKIINIMKQRLVVCFNQEAQKEIWESENYVSVPPLRTLGCYSD